MPDQVQKQNQTPLANQPSEPAEQPASTGISATEEKVIAKINDAHNILIALSSDPSVDEISAAIGLAMHIDRMGKRATAIYSGHTPNALEFLKPDETFETSADALQDFVIALSKEKADHLRYKLDGDYVKIYITPYKARISEEDLEFSYGDYNVDLVLALGVANGIDLDSALREHGRIMHDASIVNITTGNPGKFGEIEWSNKATSSVSEMLANLLYNLDNDVKIDPEEATAFLTGIVAATDRFSRANTTAVTMEIASRLMDSGAKHQLISKNITADLDNRLYDKAPQSSTPSTDTAPAREDNNSSEQASDNSFDVRNEEKATPEPQSSNSKDSSLGDSSDSGTPNAEKPADATDNSLLEELKNAEANLVSASAETTPDAKVEPVELSKMTDDMPAPITKEKVIAPSSDFVASDPIDDTSKYSKMLEDALSESATAASEPADAAPAEQASVEQGTVPSMPAVNPATSIAPDVASTPEINGVPEINYAPTDSGQVLPPPPMPPVNFDAAMPAPEMPPASSEPSPLPEPPMPSFDVPAVEPPAPSSDTPAATPPAPSPDAFKIPGM